MILFPAIDLSEGKAVRLLRGDYNRKTVFSDDPLSAARDFVACESHRGENPPLLRDRGRGPLA